MADVVTTPKTPTLQSVVDWDVTEFVRNPGGAIFDVERSHPGAEAAVRGINGWRLATLKEAQDYCARHNIDPDGLDGYEKHVKELVKAAEQQQPEPALVEAEPEPPKISIKTAKGS